MARSKRKVKWVARSAVTGRFVSHQYALKHKGTTVWHRYLV